MQSAFRQPQVAFTSGLRLGLDVRRQMLRWGTNDQPLHPVTFTAHAAQHSPAERKSVSFA